MLVLGIESTCDETSCSVVRDGKEILSNVVSSQIELHREFGGVVPELACRLHIDKIIPVLDESLKVANVTLDDIDLIAVANAPGLIGALLIGVNAAKALALATGKPLVGVNHIEAHLYAAVMGEEIPFPALGVVLSGGHTSLVIMDGVGQYREVSHTVDDAIGEAFDKVAKVIGLPYPGGPEIEKLALKGDATRFAFKAGKVKDAPLNFSFSGLKTSVLYTVKGPRASQKSPIIISEEDKADVAASFQEAAFSDIAKKVKIAAKEQNCKSIILGGGVTNNKYLRKVLAERCQNLPLYWPAPALTLDNGAMIAGLGYHRFLLDGGSEPHKLEVSTQAAWS